MLQIKGAIRAMNALRQQISSLSPEDQLHFLNLPFYETGQIIKNKPKQEDADEQSI